MVTIEHYSCTRELPVIIIYYSESKLYYTVVRFKWLLYYRELLYTNLQIYFIVLYYGFTMGHNNVTILYCAICLLWNTKKKKLIQESHNKHRGGNTTFYIKMKQMLKEHYITCHLRVN